MPITVAAAIQIIQLAIQYAPELLQEGQTVIQLLTSGQDPTPEQQASFDAAMQLAVTNYQAQAEGT